MPTTPENNFTNTTELEIGGTLNLFAVGATPQPSSYQWRLNGTNITSATNEFLLLQNLISGQAGYYTLVVSNIFGVSYSSDVNLIATRLDDHFATSKPICLGRNDGHPYYGGKGGGPFCLSMAI